MSEHNHINKQIAKGSAWMVVFKIFEKSISIVSTIILARLLSPEDFGLAAIALLVVTLLELLRAFNFDMALIHNQDATDEHYNTAWTFNIIATAIISILLICAAPLVSSFYDDERLFNIFLVLSFGVFVSGFENIGVVVFRKELEFHKEFAFLLGKKLIGFLVGIGLALYLKNHWALVGGTVATHVGIVLISYYIQGYRPRLSVSKAKELFGFSSWLFINNLMNFLNYKMPEAIIGKLSGTSSLGFFTVSADIAKLGSTEIVLPVNRAAYPGYSKLNRDYQALKNSFLNTQGILALIIIPASLGIAAITPVMVPVLLGEKWLDTIPILQLLTISFMLASLGNIQSIYMAIGKPRIMTFIFSIRIIVTLPLFSYFSYYYDLISAVTSMIAAALIMLPISFYFIMRELKIKQSELISIIIRPTLSGLMMYYSIHSVIHQYIRNTPSNYSVQDLLSLIVFGVLIYTISTYVLWAISGKPHAGETHVLNAVIQKYRKIFMNT